MKKILLLILWLFTVLFACNFTQANDEYEYTSLDITADVLEDWTMNVKENYTVNFFVKKHGIIRTIPVNYSVEWNDFHIKVSKIKVKWKKFIIDKTDKERDIKIWKANKVIDWKQEYPISYKVYWLIRNFSWMGYAELYWNLVGYDFDTNINKVNAVINLPKPYTWFTADDFLITTDWKTTSIEEFQWIVDWSQWDKIIITYDKWLPEFQWITLAIKFPNNYFKFNHRKQKHLIWKYNESLIKIIYKDYLWFWGIIIIIGFLVCAIMDIRKNIQQHKMMNKYPVIVQYSAPKNMAPSEVWLLYNRCTNPSQVISLIYKWATDWYISFEKKWSTTKIIKKKERFSAEEIKNISNEKETFIEEFSDFEYDTRKALFSGKEEVSLPNQSFNLKLSWLEKKLYLACTPMRRFEKTRPANNYDNPKQAFIDTYVWKFAIWTIVLCFFALVGEAERTTLISFITWAVSLIASHTNSKWLTDKWCKLLAHIEWYKKFIKSCDSNKIRLFLKDDPLFVDKTLPYTVALGLETNFMKNFKPIAEEMWINNSYYDVKVARNLERQIFHYTPESSGSSWSSSWWWASYSSSGWFSSWSSFWWGWWGWGFSHWWGWWGWGWRSW